MLDDIRRLFARGGIGNFLEIRDHTYRDLTLDFLSTLHSDITSGPRCQEGYISLYLNKKFYELNLSSFNQVWTCPINMSLKNLTRMHFGKKFLGIIVMIRATLKALSVETL